MPRSRPFYLRCSCEAERSLRSRQTILVEALRRASRVSAKSFDDYYVADGEALPISNHAICGVLIHASYALTSPDP